MIKQAYKIYLTPETYNKLKQLAEELGFEGRGSLGLLLNKIANEPLIFVDKNIKLMLRSLDLR